jgi:hypothetical protein
MNRQIRPVFFGACIAALLPIGATTAQAIECSVAVPSNAQRHWSYRLIDGRKCWYEGKHAISKSLLRWPAQASAQPKSDAAPISALTEKRNDPLDSQAWIPDDADSFEARWRARAISN